MPEYLARTGRARKLWVPHGGFRWPPPRLVQLVHILVCVVKGHDWTHWATDDYEGPGEEMVSGEPDSFMPYCSREARPGEYGHRSCHRCSRVQDRWPPDDTFLPRLKAELVVMDE